MTKRGFLLAEETLKLIIALIAIGFLVYLLVSIYFSTQNSKELEQARATISNVINESVKGSSSIGVYNPKNWWILSWSQEKNIPTSCLNIGLESCICVCPKEDKDTCDEKGVCIDNKGFSIQGNDIKLENLPITLKIDQTNKIISKE